MPGSERCRLQIRKDLKADKIKKKKSESGGVISPAAGRTFGRTNVAIGRTPILAIDAATVQTRIRINCRSRAGVEFIAGAGIIMAQDPQP